MGYNTSMVGTSSISAFDDIDYTETSLKPLWSIESLEDSGYQNQKLLDCLNDYVNVCSSHYRGLFEVQKSNILLYRGVQWLNQDRFNNRFLDKNGNFTRRSPKVVLNSLWDFVEQWTSKATRYRPVVGIYPTNTEFEDEQDARTSRMVLDHIWYTHNIDKLLQEWVRHIKIFGEGFLYIGWNPSKGDIHPDWLKANALNNLKKGEAPMSFPKIPVTDQEGNPILSETGEPLFIQKAVRVGDLEYRVDPPYHWFEQPVRRREDIEWAIRWQIKDVEYLKAKYPKHADKLKTNKGEGAPIVEDYGINLKSFSNDVVVYELFHKHSEFLEKGRYICFTRDCVLENTELPFAHGELPYLYMSDIEIPDAIRGMSFFQQLFPIQHQINACASLIFKSLVLHAHPKIVMPDGACEIQQLLSDSTVVTYQGGVPPTIMSSASVAPELFRYLDKLEVFSEKLSGIFTMSRGQAPSGVRAAKALRILEEQEDKRAFLFNTKYNQIGMVENAKKTLSIAAQYYDDSDGRLARVVGPDNEYDIVAFKSANLSKPYDIRIENTTSLSQSPAARLEELNEVANVRLSPDGILTREQYINFADLGRSDEFKDIATRAVRTAKAETQKILDGKPVNPPTPDEDLINHWKTHLQPVQGLDFKERVPAERKEALMQHIRETEYLMFKKAYGIPDQMGGFLTMPNLMFRQKLLQECINWPVYFEMPIIAEPIPMQAPESPAALASQDIGIAPAPLDPGLMPQGVMNKQ